jgi:hypothetical protein
MSRRNGIVGSDNNPSSSWFGRGWGHFWKKVKKWTSNIFQKKGDTVTREQAIEANNDGLEGVEEGQDKPHFFAEVFSKFSKHHREAEYETDTRPNRSSRSNPAYEVLYHNRGKKYRKVKLEKLDDKNAKILFDIIKNERGSSGRAKANIVEMRNYLLKHAKRTRKKKSTPK